LNHKKIDYTMAFSNNKYTLLNRIKRMVNPKNKRFTLKEGISSLFIIVIGLMFMSFTAKIILNSTAVQNVMHTFKVKEKIMPPTDVKNHDPQLSEKLFSFIRSGKPESDIKEPKMTNSDDTIVRILNDHEIEYHINGTVYKLLYDKNNKVTAFLINYKAVAETDWNTYEKEIQTGFELKKKIDKEMKIHKEEMAKHEKEMKIHEKEMLVFKEEMEMHKKTMEDYEKQMALHAEDLKKHQKDMEEFERERALIEVEMEKHEAEREKQIQELKIHQEELKIHEQEMKKHQQEMMLHKEKLEIVNEMIEQMKKDKLIDPNSTSYSVRFTETELFINDKKQPENFFQKYKQFFLERSEGKFKFEGEYNFKED